MRVVVDTNRLRSSELAAFLLLSPENRAVINEWVAIETYKQKSAAQVVESYKTLSGFPGQVIVLRGTAACAQAGGDADAMINLADTGGFPFFASAMARAHAGDELVLQQIVERRGWAADQLARMEADLPDSGEVMSLVRGMMVDEQWARFARGEPFSPRMRDTFTEATVRIAGLMADLHPAGIHLPDPPALYDEFTFRLALSLMIHLFDQAKQGARTRSRPQAINDRIDVFHIAYGTYFNGLMTSDARCARTHMAVRAALRGVGAGLQDDYADAMREEVVALIDEQRARVGKPPLERPTL